MLAYTTINSSWVEGLGYDSEAKVLYVGTKTGKYFAYFNVATEPLLTNFLNGESVGKYVNELKAMCEVREVSLQDVINACGLASEESIDLEAVPKKRKIDFRNFKFPAMFTGWCSQ